MKYHVFCTGLGGTLENSESIFALTPRGAVFDWCRAKFACDPQFAQEIDGRAVIAVPADGALVYVKVTVRCQPEWELEELEGMK